MENMKNEPVMLVQEKLFFENRELSEFLECHNHAGYLIMFADNNELRLIPYIAGTNLKKGK